MRRPHEAAWRLGRRRSGQRRAASVAGAARRNDLRLLLGVMGVPLAPVHVCAAEPLPHLSIKDTPIETSSAQYILQQYLAASGGQKLLSYVRNMRRPHEAARRLGSSTAATGRGELRRSSSGTHLLV